MNLQEIAESLPVKYQTWGKEHIEELEAASSNEAIRERVVGLIHEAIYSPQTRTGNPLTATRNAMRLSAFANFRFGLLIGILLHEEPAPEEDKPLLLPDAEARPCPSCLGKGVVCFACEQPQADCTCSVENSGRGFDPVDCETCNGKGELPVEEKRAEEQQ
jgi:hypothetical protein